jgi:hypothetical protein
MKAPALPRGLLALFVVACGLLAPSLCAAAVPMTGPLPATSVVEADWQGPLSLPPRFRNHCAIDFFSGRHYCSNHCGIDYQFYYCTSRSFGCCRVGFGYCDGYGHLRCHP